MGQALTHQAKIISANRHYYQVQFALQLFCLLKDLLATAPTAGKILEVSNLLTKQPC